MTDEKRHHYGSYIELSEYPDRQVEHNLQQMLWESALKSVGELLFERGGWHEVQFLGFHLRVDTDPLQYWWEFRIEPAEAPTSYSAIREVLPGPEYPLEQNHAEDLAKLPLFRGLLSRVFGYRYPTRFTPVLLASGGAHAARLPDVEPGGWIVVRSLYHTLPELIP